MSENPVVQVNDDFISAVNGAKYPRAVECDLALAEIGLNIVFEVQVKGRPYGKAVVREYSADENGPSIAKVIAVGGALEEQNLPAREVA